MPPRGLTDLERQQLINAPVFNIERSLSMTTGDSVFDNGPMVIDLDPNVLPENQWILEGLSFIAAVANAPADGRWLPPVSGLFLCPPGTKPETQDTASFDLSMQTRPVPVPLDPYSAFRSIPGTLGVAVGAVQMVAQSGFQVSVPGGWFARAILILDPGGGAGSTRTGPGQESYGKCTAMVRVLKQR